MLSVGLAIRLKEVVEVGEGNRTVEAGETALLGDQLGGADETGPGGAREGRADADAAHSEFREIGNPKTRVGAHQDIHRLRTDRADDGLDVLAGLGPGRVKDIRAGFRVGLQTPDRFLQRFWMTNQIALGACGEENA